jgi:hypothetical protein
MEYLPIEILDIEIGKYLDLSGIISMSFVNKSMMEIYHPKIKQIVSKLDPFAKQISVYDLLRMMRIGTLENATFKIYRFLIQNIINEINRIYPYLSKEKIISIFSNGVPDDAINELKTKITNFIQTARIFLIYRNVVYRNYLVDEVIDLNKVFEMDLIDMIDPLMHELSLSDQCVEYDEYTSSDTASNNDSEQIIDYFPYENIIDSMNHWIGTL